MVDWTDPMVIVGIAQVIMAFVLVVFTAFLWRSTDKYAKLTEADLDVKEKIRKLEQLNKEMDLIIGPLYSKLGDPIYFNPESVIWKFEYKNNPNLAKYYKGSDFWRDIKKNLYLTTPQTRKGIIDYLDVKLGIATFSREENDPSYQKALKKIETTVKERCKELKDKLDSR